MTDNQKAQARVFFENRILKSDKQAFEDLFTEIMNYKELDFRSIKPWGNIGDRKNDGYIESRGIFYQVYAPEDIRKSYPDVIKKIKTDFNGLIEQWSNVREFYFVVNDKYKGVNPDSEQLLQQIKEDNNLVEAKFITAKDLENILFTLSNDQIIKITGITFFDSIILTSAILKNTYLKKFDTISLLTTNIPKPIDEIFINLAIIKEQKEAKDKENFINREAFLNSYEEIHKPKKLIEIKELVKTANKSLIYGKAGIGKTTLCKYIAYMWAKGELYQEFEYVVYIPLREWENNGIKGAIQDYYYSRDSEKLTIDIAPSRMLFLFDGYDELNGDKKKALIKEIEHYNLTHYIITTRPYGYQRNDFSIDEHFETIGFTDENVDSYIDKFFKKDDEKSQSLKNYLQSNISIKHIVYIPLMLEMICSLWEEEEFSESLTMTELYSKVIEDMLNKYSASKDDERVFKRKNRKQIKAYLGKIAFKGLTKQTILFDGDLIEDAIENIEFFEENVIYSGFLKSDVKEKDLLDNHFEFPHLTFQEYFAALYVSNLLEEEQSKIIRDWKFYPHMQMFFAFLGGLIKDKEFLIREIESEPRDTLGLYEILLIILCMNNKKQIKNIQLRLSVWLKFLLYKLHGNEIIFSLLERFETNHFLIDSKIENTFIAYIKDKNNNDWLKPRLLSLLINIKENDTNIINLFIEFIKNDSITTLYRKEIIKFIIENKIYNKKLQNHLYDFLLNSNIHCDIRGEIIILLFPILKNNHLENIAMNFLEDKNNEFWIKVNVAYKLFKLGHSSIKILELLEYINDEDEDEVDIDEEKKLIPKSKLTDEGIENISILLEKSLDSTFKEKLIKVLISTTRTDKKYVEYIFKLIKSKNIIDWNRRELIKKVTMLAENDNQVMDMLISFIEDESIDAYIRVDGVNALSKSTYFDNVFFRRIDINKYFSSSFSRNSSVKSFFKAFDNSYIELNMIIENALYHGLPLYLKNNKLHTIENGKEICTQREVDEETLNKINMLLKGDDLDD